MGERRCAILHYPDGRITPGQIVTPDTSTESTFIPDENVGLWRGPAPDSEFIGVINPVETKIKQNGESENGARPVTVQVNEKQLTGFILVR